MDTQGEEWDCQRGSPGSQRPEVWAWGDPRDAILGWVVLAGLYRTGFK